MTKFLQDTDDFTIEDVNNAYLSSGKIKSSLLPAGTSNVFSDLTDVTISAVQTNDVVHYTGGQWVNTSTPILLSLTLSHSPILVSGLGSGAFGNFQYSSGLMYLSDGVNNLLDITTLLNSLNANITNLNLINQDLSNTINSTVQHHTLMISDAAPSQAIFHFGTTLNPLAYDFRGFYRTGTSVLWNMKDNEYFSINRSTTPYNINSELFRINASGLLYLTSATSAAVGEIAYNSGVWTMGDSGGQVSIRQLETDRADYVSKVNQALLTTSDVSFNTINTPNATTNDRSIVLFSGSGAKFNYIGLSRYNVDGSMMCNSTVGFTWSHASTPWTSNTIHAKLYTTGLFSSLSAFFGAIGTSSRTLYVSGDQESTSASTFIYTSDKRAKRDVAPLDGKKILNAFNDIEFVEYRHVYSNDKKYGVIAQDLLANDEFSCCIGKTDGESKFTDVKSGEEVTIQDCLNFNTDPMLMKSFVCIQELYKIIQTQQLQINRLNIELGI